MAVEANYLAELVPQVKHVVQVAITAVELESASLQHVLRYSQSVEKYRMAVEQSSTVVYVLTWHVAGQCKLIAVTNGVSQPPVWH